MKPDTYSIIAIEGFPIISDGEDLVPHIVQALTSPDEGALPGDILIIAHTIVSISEGRTYDERYVKVTPEAEAIAIQTGQAAAKIALALEEAEEILRSSPVLITRTRQGIISDYSGVDSSNAPEGCFIKLPVDSYQSAEKLHVSLSKLLGFHLPVIVADTQGRPWRRGAVNLALGVAGMDPFTANRGKRDLYGRELSSSEVCLADELAGAAELAMGQADEGIPLVIIRGLDYIPRKGASIRIEREYRENLFT
ncbi:MAG: coenzyme F420-0:L-glutamate ligase [Candidatus Thorarchaeota archaeon]|nr:coenzyme F420-0:L-glutamate ligase [Candidatus Thorarchaeota archaeon]